MPDYKTEQRHGNLPGKSAARTDLTASQSSDAFDAIAFLQNDLERYSVEFIPCDNEADEPLLSGADGSLAPSAPNAIEIEREYRRGYSEAFDRMRSVPADRLQAEVGSLHDSRLAARIAAEDSPTLDGRKLQAFTRASHQCAAVLASFISEVIDADNGKYLPEFFKAFEDCVNAWASEQDLAADGYFAYPPDAYSVEFGSDGGAMEPSGRTGGVAFGHPDVMPSEPTSDSNVKPVATPAKMDVGSCPSFAADNYGTLMRRARSYVDRADLPAEGNRNNSAFRLAGNLLAFDEQGEALTIDEVHLLMTNWNCRLAEPLSDFELEKAVQSSATNGTSRQRKESDRLNTPMGFDFPGWTSPKRPSVDDDTAADHATILKQLGEGLESSAMFIPNEDMMAALGEAHGRAFKVYDPAEFDDTEFRVEFLIDNLLAKDQMAVVAGPSKSMKTTTSIAMAVALATGEPFFGEYPVNGTNKVLFLSAESGMATIKSTYRRIVNSVDPSLKPSDIDIFFGDWVPHAKQGDKLAAVRYWMDKIKPDVVFIDPVYQTVDGSDAANLSLMGQQLATISRQVLHFGATPILVHHTRKTAQAVMERKPLEIHDLAGAGVTEFFRQWVLVNRRERYRPDQPHKLWLSVGGSAGHASEWALDIDDFREAGGLPRGWATELHHPDDVASERAEAAETRKQIKEDSETADSVQKLAAYFTGSPEPAPYKVIERRSGATGKKLDRALARMENLKALRVEKMKGGNGRMTDHYVFDQAVYSDTFGQ